MMVVTQNHHMNFEAKLCRIELDKNLLRINFRYFSCEFRSLHNVDRLTHSSSTISAKPDTRDVYVLFTFSLIASLNEHSENCSCTADPWSLTTLREIYAIQHIRRTRSEKTKLQHRNTHGMRFNARVQHLAFFFFCESRIIMHRAVCLYSLPNSFITRVFRTVKKTHQFGNCLIFRRSEAKRNSIADWLMYFYAMWVRVPPSSLFANHFTIARTEKNSYSK